MLADMLLFGVKMMACIETNVSTYTFGSDDEYEWNRHSGIKSTKYNKCRSLQCTQDELDISEHGGISVNKLTKISCKVLKKKNIIATYLKFVYENEEHISLKLYKLSIMGILTS